MLIYVNTQGVSAYGYYVPLCYYTGCECLGLLCYFILLGTLYLVIILLYVIIC